MLINVSLITFTNTYNRQNALTNVLHQYALVYHMPYIIIWMWHNEHCRTIVKYIGVILCTLNIDGVQTFPMTPYRDGEILTARD